MPNISQIYTILNAVGAQALGTSAISVVDTRSMVALGDAVIASDTNKDAFVGALVDRIGRTIVSVRAYDDPTNDPLVKKPFEYGSILQKIYVDIEDAAADNAWNIGDANYTPEFAPVYKPDVRQKLFDKISVWNFNYTIPDHQLKTAFVSESSMSAFITAIYTAMDNSLMLSLRNANNLVRCTAIAHTINRGGANAINLFGEYKTAFPSTTLTAATCLTDADFLRFAARRIIDVMRYMKDLVRVWNNESFARHTPNDMLVATLLQTFDSAEVVNLQSDTFHKELVKLGNYRTVSFWQGTGTGAYAFNDISSVEIKIPDPADSTKNIDVEQAGIIAVLHDIEAMGSTINDRYANTQRNNKDRYTDFFTSANIGYFYDGSENIVVFYVEDPKP